MIRTVLNLPISDSGCQCIRIVTNGVTLTADYEYFSEDSGKQVGSIRFERIAAFRFRDEMRSFGFADGSYDTLVELIDSDWLHQLIEIEPPAPLLGVTQRRHFAVFFSSNGYLEVIARDFVDLGSRDGGLSE